MKVNWDEGMVNSCLECGYRIIVSMTFCPACGVDLEVDENEEMG